MTDPIGKAIAAADGQVVMFSPGLVVISSTGRPFKIDVPADMTEGEMIEMVGWIVTALAGHLKAQRPASRIILPGPVS